MNTLIRNMKPVAKPQAGVAAASGRWLPWLLVALCSPLLIVRSHAADFTAPDQLRKQLYYAEADSSGLYPKASAAFRYKELLYGVDPASNKLRADFANVANSYGNAEKAWAAQVAELIWGKLNNSTTNDTEYGPLLLDLYYDRAAAESILAQNLLDVARKARYGPPLSPPPTGGFYINNEIPAYTNALAAYRSALSNYFVLFTRTRTTPNPPNPPVTDNPGTLIFKSRVPTRGLTPANYLSGGILVPVSGTTNALFNGYKDLVLINGLLRDYGRVAETLGRLYIARAGASDVAAAKALVTDVQRTVYLQGNLLRGLFPNLAPATVAGSGLAESQAGWEKALATLDQLRQTLDGKANLLGFAPDFLVLVQGALAGEQPRADTYDAFLAHLATANSALGRAVSDLAAARNSYSAYRGFEDQLQSAFENLTGEATNRLIQIVGVYPYPGGNDTPLAGSEAGLQLQSIESARLQIEKNQAEISNLKKQVQIEINRRGRERGINNAIADVQVSYGNKQASLTEEIAEIEARQAAANGLAEEASAAGDLNLFGTAAHGANAVYQTTAEQDKGKLEARKERLAAQQSAEITSLTDGLLDVNSKANIETWMLQMNTLVIDSQQAALQLAQEQGRFVALAREKADLEATIAESDSSLAGRYFADPVHRLAAQSALAKANLSFAEAQKWLFFMARALEYKWNRPLDNLWQEGYGGGTLADLFKLRNAEELQDMYAAMQTFDDEHVLSSTSDDRFDWFSVRENFLGYTRTNDLGQAATYIDPVTGQTNDALGAFRLHLSRLVTNGFVELDFSTARELQNKSFFRGPTYFPSGAVDPSKPGSYLDKIRWLKIRLPGGHAQLPTTGYLRYGGTSYIRNPQYGIRDPLRPDRILDEMTAYNTRRWKKEGNQWRFTDGLNAEISMLMIPRSETRLDGNPLQPDALPSVNQIDVFRERPVAASAWHLAIPVTGPGSVTIANLDDIEIYFYHWSFNR